jgi:hypothetical protein
LKQKEENYKKETERHIQKIKVLENHIQKLKDKGSEEMEALVKKTKVQEQELQKAHTKEIVTLPDVRTQEKLKKTK